jgi:hypothetical protein
MLLGLACGAFGGQLHSDLHPRQTSSRTLPGPGHVSKETAQFAWTLGALHLVLLVVLAGGWFSLGGKTALGFTRAFWLALMLGSYATGVGLALVMDMT